MATIPETETAPKPVAEPSVYDEEGYPWLENGERMKQKEFHERYLKTPEGFHAELIGGVVYVMASPLKNRHARSDAVACGWLFTYSLETPGTVVQNNATTILAENSEPQPDSALLILPEFGGQSRDGDDESTYGAPELIVETAFSSRSIDLGEKLRDYEKAGVREYIVVNLKSKVVLWHAWADGRFDLLTPDPDGLYRSHVFPGLWLDPDALTARDAVTMIAALRRGLQTPEHAAFVAELERRRATRA